MPVVVSSEIRAASTRRALMRPSSYRGRLAASAVLAASTQLPERGLCLVGLALVHRDDLRCRRDGLVVLLDVVEERLHLGALQRRRARIHEQRTRERLVLPALDRLGRRLDAAAAAVDLH